jgi:hypothetical protein
MITLKKKTLGLFLLILFMPPISRAEKQIVLSFSSGYSSFFDSGISSGSYIEKNLINFTEQLELKNRFSLNLQYFFNHHGGLQLELDHQTGDYTSSLKWTGIPNPNPFSENPVIFIHHYEDPYTEGWSFTGLTLSALYTFRKEYTQKLSPYGFFGIGAYWLSGHKEKVLERFRLGPSTFGRKARFGGGFKFRLSSKMAINVRAFLETLTRRNLGYDAVFSGLYVGPKQFRMDLYYEYNRIVRVNKVLTRTVSYIGIDIGFEFVLR